MAKKDEILDSFLAHDILRAKYKLKESDLDLTIREAVKSPHPILGAIALIVENLEAAQPPTDNALRTMITQYLNEKAI